MEGLWSNYVNLSVGEKIEKSPKFYFLFRVLLLYAVSVRICVSLFSLLIFGPV